MDMDTNRELAERTAPAAFKPAFEAGRDEKWAIFYCAAAAYVYVLAMFGAAWKLWLLIFAGMFSTGVEMFYREQPAKKESYIWLGCLWVCLMGVFTDGKWTAIRWFSIHGFAAYWVLIRSGRSMLLETSRFLPADMLCAGIVYPFKHFFLNLRVFGSIWGSAKRYREKRGILISSLVAVAVSAVLFCASGILLGAADPNFGMLTAGISGMLERIAFEDAIIKFCLSLPVGAYLFGMVCGMRRENMEMIQHRKEGICRWISGMRRVPHGVWMVVMSGFAAMYLVFFGMQAGYLFSAFENILPEQFTAAEYARRGFFELCRVMTIDFMLLGLVSISGEKGIRSSRALKMMGSLILMEGILFAVIAASKLYLYIDRFGFTPLRLQSCWMIGVLTAGCAASLASLWSGRDTMKPWALFSGITLAALCVF